MIYPILYKKTSTGASQAWMVSVEGNVIVTRWGQLGGALQETRDTVLKGKNLGKANATTPEEQAVLEAQSLWEKKLKKGYVRDLADAKAGKTDEVIAGGIFPMLANRFDEQGHKLKYPCLVQPKFDGHRCIAVVKDGKCTLWSRTRKPITSMGHIVAAIESLPDVTHYDFVLDGELYHHDYKDRFEELTSFIRDTDAKPGSDVVQYHIYDIVNGDPQDIRTSMLFELLDGGVQGIPRPHSPLLVYVSTQQVDDEDELLLMFQNLLGQGYEGAMARNTNGLYVNKRSYDLLKIKEFIDSEFEVVGVEEGRGKLVGHGIFVCKTADGALFKAKMIGSTADLKQYYENPALAIGRQLTVKYQALTAKNGVPRFPVAMRFV